MKAQTIFQQVVELNQRAGNRPEFTWAQLDQQMMLIEEEFTELQEAIHSGDVIDMADQIVDMLVTVYGLGWLAGLDVDAIGDHVLEKLRTRIDISPELAEKTKQHYQERGIDCYIRTSYLPHDVECKNPYFAVISTKDQPGAPAGKWLKSIFRFEPDIASMVPQEVKDRLG